MTYMTAGVYRIGQLYVTYVTDSRCHKQQTELDWNVLWRVKIHILMQYMHTIEGDRAVEKYSINEFNLNLLLSFI